MFKFLFFWNIFDYNDLINKIKLNPLFPSFSLVRMIKIGLRLKQVWMIKIGLRLKQVWMIKTGLND